MLRRTDIHSREVHRVEPTGEAQERQTPAHLEAHNNGRVGGKIVHMVGSKVHFSK